MNTRPVCLFIMDGYGLRDSADGNAIKIADAGVIASLAKKYPSTELQASGMFVGLPDGQMGNSEVGHLNIGAGRVVYQELTRITKAISDGDFFENEELLGAVENATKNGKKLHLYGLTSSGGVHSHIEHLFGLLELCKRKGVKDVFVHCFMDGRDVSPTSGVDFISQLESKMKTLGVGKIASIAGRYYAMDRDNRWDRVEKGYNCLLFGEGEKASSAIEGVKTSYANNITDEFVLPTAIGGEESRIHDNDAIIFFNYRPDRAREISKAINFSDFDGFERKKVLNNIYYCTMTSYDASFTFPVAFPKTKPENILGDVLEANGIKQFRTAETEKYAHVTFFFNGGIDEPQPHETRKLVASPKVATYDLQPEMSAPEVCENVLSAIENKDYGFILVNFANPDMVGHTGVLEAAEIACKTVDTCVGKIADKCKEYGVTMVLTADHGNAEVMFNEQTGKPHTAHTTNVVPFVVINAPYEVELREGGALCDVAPTILQLMGIKQPEEMTGKSMLKTPALR